MLEQKEENKNNNKELNHIESNEVVEKEELVQVGSNVQVENSEDIKGGKTMKPTFMDTLKASLIDLIVIGGISAALVFVADSIMRLAGYFVAQKIQMSFIIFMVVMVLYMSIMESGKASTTLGKKLSGLTITKG